MVRFGQHKPPTNLLSGREQRRLLVLVFLLGLVIFLMREARDPRRWQWMWRAGSASQVHAIAQDASDVPPSAAGRDAGEIDTRLHPPTLSAGGVTVVSSGATNRKSHSGRLPGVRSELFEHVRDDTPFRGAEHEAWFHLFDLLRKTDAQHLADSSVGAVDFAQLFQQSHEYRGQVVTVRGTVRRALWVTAPRNSLGLDGYYQLTLQPLGYQASPIIIYALSLPEAFPTGEAISAEIIATGFSFKRWAYPATDAIRLAPVVLVATVDWSRPVAVAPAVRSGKRTVWLGVGLLAVLLASVVYLVRQSSLARVVRPTTVPAPDWNRLEGLGAQGTRYEAEQASPREEDAS